MKYSSRVFLELLSVIMTLVPSIQTKSLSNKIIHKTPERATLDMSCHLIFVVRCDFTEIEQNVK
jgi:hypothetical protein